ncbi:PQQ-dependent sugar dehydrogenase [Aurantiacibacter rhizosphaerae]|uniref:PQQ-dependent sugar dehydrogenase n=1 Tax=Aurantiacibacter rhizosphaerae TaxID=2691582 RepID=A0A844X924_9SPHN|nr:PQQ-dependent sugar dehydrogenase [Aurantiacibacter rhizosphaerae]MWV26891.1 PQQ-dependent sugar dehydrogenase [Aurantiacibacter rhizosphaerae]
MNRKNVLASNRGLASAVASLMGAAAAVCLPVSLHASEVEDVSVPAELPGPGPYLYTSAEVPALQVEIVTNGLSPLYAIEFLPNGDALLVERGAQLRLLRDATGDDAQLESVPVAGAPAYLGVDNLHPDDVLGIQDIVLDPDFANNSTLYFTYNKPIGLDEDVQRITASTVLARAIFDGERLHDITDILTGEAMVGVGGSRILPTSDGMLYISVGALSTGDIESAQRTDNIYGKSLRIRKDGTVPQDNPYAQTAGARPEIWTYGHRDPLGLAADPKTGRLVSSEHGPQGGDELNELMAGGNYGWPQSTYGTEYGGSPLPANPVAEGTTGPLLIWSPSIAPNGIAFYTGDAMPGWERSLFVTSARRGQINGTGALIRLVLNDDLQEVRQEVLLADLHQRMKDVAQGPDGLLYVVTDEPDSIVLRIKPADDGDEAAAPGD